MNDADRERMQTTSNPLATGIGPIGRFVSDALWIEQNVALIDEVGAEAYLEHLLESTRAVLNEYECLPAENYEKTMEFQDTDSPTLLRVLSKEALRLMIYTTPFSVLDPDDWDACWEKVDRDMEGRLIAGAEAVLFTANRPGIFSFVRHQGKTVSTSADSPEVWTKRLGEEFFDDLWELAAEQWPLSGWANKLKHGCSSSLGMVWKVQILFPDEPDHVYLAGMVKGVGLIDIQPYPCITPKEPLQWGDLDHAIDLRETGESIIMVPELPGEFTIVDNDGDRVSPERDAEVRADWLPRFRSKLWLLGAEWWPATKWNYENREIEPDGSVPLHPLAAEAIEEQIQVFTEKFGRPPGPNDPLLFDPDADEPREMTDKQKVELHKGMLGGMIEGGMDPVFIHAFQQTGILVTQMNQHLIDPEDLAAWNRAIEEFQSSET